MQAQFVRCDGRAFKIPTEKQRKHTIIKPLDPFTAVNSINQTYVFYSALACRSLVFPVKKTRDFLTVKKSSMKGRDEASSFSEKAFFHSSSAFNLCQLFIRKYYTCVFYLSYSHEIGSPFYF